MAALSIVRHKHTLGVVVERIEGPLEMERKEESDNHSGFDTE